MAGYSLEDSLKLIGVLAFHEGALDYDLRSRVGFTVDEVYAGRVAWNTAAGIVAEILRDPYSHLTAAVNGWSFVPSPSDVLLLNWVDAQAEMHHQKGTVRPAPVKRPWEHGQRERVTAVTADPERPARRAALAERLGLNT